MQTQTLAHTPRLSLAIAAIVLTTGCASIRPAEFNEAAQNGRANVLTASEIAQLNVNSAYDALERVRPNFLSGFRTPVQMGGRAVYLDGMLLGGLEDLRRISASSIKEIRLLSSMDATTRFGTGNTTGALVITTLPGSRSY